jgi:hypothetical protein
VVKRGIKKRIANIKYMKAINEWAELVGRGRILREQLIVMIPAH